MGLHSLLLISSFFRRLKHASFLLSASISFVIIMSLTAEEDAEIMYKTKNYTSTKERYHWYLLNIGYKHNRRPDRKAFFINKEHFRQRREGYCYSQNLCFRINFQNNNEIGAFLRLTNSYALVAPEEEPKLFSKTIKGDFSNITVTNTTIAGCNVIGRMCVGNSKGLLVPDSIYDTEFNHIKNELPESVQIKKLEEQLSALGNVIVCNDHIALIHPDINKETEEIIADVLQVEVFRTTIGTNPLVGSYCIISNNGGLVQPDINGQDVEHLSSLLQLRLATGTVNCGCEALGSGLVVNDYIAYAGMKTTSHEFSSIESAFHLK